MNNIFRFLLLSLLTLAVNPISFADDDIPKAVSEHVFDDRGNRIIKYRLINKHGDHINEDLYDNVSPFSANGLALVQANNYYGYINTKGEYFMPVGLRGARPFNQFGLAIIRYKNKWSVINSEKFIIVKEFFDKIEDYQSNGLAIVKYEKKYGLVDTLGNVVLPVIYDKVENFDKSGYATIKSGNKYGIVDRRGRAVIAAEHKDKKSALAALSDIKTQMAKQDLSLADVAKINNITTSDYSSEQPQNAEEQKQLADKDRKEKEQKLLADKARKEEEQRQLAEKARKEEEQRQLAEKVRKEEEEKLLAEQARMEEEQKRKEEARKRLAKTHNLKNYIAANLGEWNDFLASRNLNIPSEEEIRDYIEAEVTRWQVKGEFEPTARWKERVNETTRAAKINAMADSIFASSSQAVEAAQNDYRQQYEALVDTYCDNIARQFESQNLVIRPYDADNETFLISSEDFGDFLLPVPLEEAPGFKQEWDKWKTAAIASFVPNGDDVALKSVKIGKYSYDSDMDATYAQVDVEYNFKPVDVAALSHRLDTGNDMAMTSATEPAPAKSKGIHTGKVKISAGTAAEVDINIPQGKANQSNTFAVVIANGEYAHASNVDHAENDGRVMTQYLTRTLGIPEKNVATFINATYGQMASAISMLQDIGDAYQGSDFNIMFYYVGHGLPDDEGKKSYVLPVDIDPRMVSICMPLEKIYADLGNLGAKNVTVMVDACFSGANHGEGMLVPQSMGVAMRPKKASPVGNMVVLTAADGNETAFPYDEKSHGLFTYWLLKKLQDTSGDVTIGELTDYVIDNVKKTSVTVNRKPQTPTVATSPQLTDIWRSMPFGK